jgi:hypothetical protein
MAKQQITKNVHISLLPPHDIRTEDKDIEDVLLFEEADITVLFNALTLYQPAENEEQRYGILLETLDEVLTRDTY